MINIAIDGPAGAGKSTIAKLLAKRLSILYVDTGAMYRAIGYYVSENYGEEITPGVDDISSNPVLNAFIEENIDQIHIELKYHEGEQHIFLNGEDVSLLIRTPFIGQMASIVSANAKVRMYGVELQREIASKSDVIMDGRDIGSFVIPDAPLKVYLTASSKVRGQRRYEQLVEKGESPNLNQLIEEIEARDYRDMNREFAPLKKADDALVVDTSDMTIDQVVDTIEGLAKDVFK